MKKNQPFSQKFRRGPDIAPLDPEKRPTDTSIALLWCAAWFRRWFTATALLPIPAMVLVTLYALIAQNSPSRYLLLIILALGICALVTTLLFLPVLEIVRIVPARAAAGEPFPVEYKVRNRSRWRTFYDLRLDPYPFSRDLEILHAPAIPHLAPGQTVTVSAQYRQKRRGVLLCYRPLAETAFPFGLFKGSCRDGMEQRIILYPRFRQLENCPVPAGQARRVSGTVEQPRVGNSPEFLGCRDYRTGDDVRRIDWRGSARRGTPVVREFEEERYRKISLIVDTELIRKHPKGLRLRRFLYQRWFPRRRPASPWEAELALTLAVGEALLRQSASLDCLWLGKEVHTLQDSREPLFHQLCDLLGAAEPSPDGIPDLETLPRHLANTGGAILFLLQDDPERRNLAAALTESGIALEVLVISRRPGSLPPRWRALSPEEILSGAVDRL